MLTSWNYWCSNEATWKQTHSVTIVHGHTCGWQFFSVESFFCNRGICMSCFQLCAVIGQYLKNMRMHHIVGIVTCHAQRNGSISEVTPFTFARCLQVFSACWKWHLSFHKRAAVSKQAFLTRTERYCNLWLQPVKRKGARCGVAALNFTRKKTRLTSHCTCLSKDS